MEIIIKKNYEEVSQVAANMVIKGILINNRLILGLATGSSPIGLYNNLIDAFESNIISFKNVKTYNLDEYVGIARTHPQSYYSFMHENLFKHIDIKKENINNKNG
jgi:glucosamine-6-phosphate deaminase